MFNRLELGVCLQPGVFRHQDCDRLSMPRSTHAGAAGTGQQKGAHDLSQGLAFRARSADASFSTNTWRQRSLAGSPTLGGPMVITRQQRTQVANEPTS